MRSLLIPSALILSVVGGCEEQRASRVDPGAAARWPSDSAKYAKDSASYARQMHVLDSLSRRVNTDSLYGLYRATLTARDVVAAAGAVNCEHDRLARLHGLIPSEYAIKRMVDTLHKAGEADAWKHFDDRLASMSVQQTVNLGEWPCGDLPPVGPSSVNGVSLTAISGSPLRPIKPPGLDKP